jgi:N-acetylglucosaminyldiphosphoundecaprenol N-acetyl-beta-D-mannosaminyltransferase
MPEEQGKVDILEVSFDNVTREEAVQRVISLLAQPERKGYVVTPNSEIVYMCRKQPGLLEALNDAYLVLPDGIGVIYAGKILKRPLKGKVAGIDFASRLMEEMARRGDSLFLLGAKPGVAALAGERLQQKYPGLHICGVHDGYFKEDASVIREVNESGAKVLFVCLGAPKQEHWMQDHMNQLNVQLMVGLGGSLDVFSGQVKRAPDVWVKLGLEWLYRLIREPKRIGRMCKLPLFLLASFGARMRGE